MSGTDDLIVVFAGTSADAGFVKNLLEGNGIKAVLQNEIMGTIAPYLVTPGGVGSVKVAVLKKDASEAKIIAQDFISGKQSN